MRAIMVMAIMVLLRAILTIMIVIMVVTNWGR